ncbi:hypothetical protein [Sulfitobacter sabulilitoris]|uniref:hypothetical protein n=1 Tax=Sulfitobacter sabulilitoris TaxID=2562655 RepID=UPI0014785646|nr:hypothetical protein [Sulfitobacter sabulilitoris]
MLRTITLGSCVSVQGTYLGDLPDGRIAVKVDQTVYAGSPVVSARQPHPDSMLTI